MKSLAITLLLLLGGVSCVYADQQVTFSWKPGNCVDSYKLYRATSSGWIEVAETSMTSISIVVPNRDVRWRVSGICNSGINKGEWWSRQGAWTGKSVDVSIKKQ